MKLEFTSRLAGDWHMHQSVRVSRWESDNVISLIPPDGEFTLLGYRKDIDRQPPIFITSVIEMYPNSRILYTIQLNCSIPEKSSANDVKIFVPVPPDVDTPTFKVPMGDCKYLPEKSGFLWHIKKMKTKARLILYAKFSLPSVSSEEKFKQGPVMVDCDINDFTASGLGIKYVKVVEKADYAVATSMRVMTLCRGLEFITKEIIIRH